jgi:hypothetical protein
VRFRVLLGKAVGVDVAVLGRLVGVRDGVVVAVGVDVLIAGGAGAFVAVAAGAIPSTSRTIKITFGPGRAQRPMRVSLP